MFSQLEKIEGLLEETKPLLPSDRFGEINSLFEEKTKSFCLKILLYGPYNSGKTMLINALAGEKLFTSAPLPETSQLQPVRFGEYEIIDSPGFGAPDPHAEELSKKAAKWDADLVLFVVSSGGHLESERISNEISDLLESGRTLLFVVNEIETLSDDDREKIKSRLHAYASRALWTKPEASFYGPLFVNAESALKARTSSPRKRKLEEESGILALEETIHQWLSNQGKYAPLATITANLLEELKRARAEALKHIGEIDPRWQEALEKIGEIEKDMEDFVLREVTNRIEHLVKWARDMLYSEKQPDDFQAFWADFLAELEATLNGMISLADGRLVRLLDRLCEDIPLGTLESQIRIPQNLLQSLFREPEQDSSMPANERDDKITRITEALANTDENRYRPIVTSFAVTASKGIALAQARGAFASLGMAGKVLGGLGKALPLIGLAVDIGFILRDLYRHEKHKEKLVKALERELEEQEKKEEARRRAIIMQIKRVSSDVFQSVGDQILIYFTKLLSERRQVFLEKMREEKQVNESARQRVVSLDQAIDKAQELLVALQGGLER